MAIAREGNFDVRTRVSPLTQRVLEHVLDRVDLGDREVLDVGCGAGFQSLALAKKGARVFLADLDPVQVAAAKRRLAMHYPDALLGAASVDCQAMPFQDASFDAVLTQSVLMYVDRNKVADEAFRCLRPGGHWIIVEHLGKNPLLRAYRMFTPGRDGARWVQDAEWSRIERKFTPIERQAFFITGALTEIPLKLGFSRLGQMCGSVLWAVDDWLIQRFTSLRSYCWIAIRLLQKP